MRITNLKKALDLAFKADQAVHITGHAGIGKTQVTNEYALENGHFIKTYNIGGCSDTADLLGTFSETNNTTIHLIPKWAQELIDFCEANPDKYGIVFLDEFSRGKADIIQALFPLPLEKRLLEHPFPKNSRFVFADNPDTGDYQSPKFADAALSSRFIKLKVESTPNDFISYRKDRGASPLFLSFYEANNDCLSANYEDFSLDQDIKPDHRAWEAVEKICKVAQETEAEEHILFELIQGKVGVSATYKFRDHYKSGLSAVAGLDVVERFSKVEKTLKDQISKSRTDLIMETSQQLTKLLNESLPSEKQMKNVVKYFDMLTAEQQRFLWKNLYTDNNNDNLVNTFNASPVWTDYFKNRGNK